MINLLLFDNPPPPRYPQIAGAKGVAETSRDAADVITESGRAATLRARVLEALQGEAMTADECAARLGESVLACRPRLSELFKLDQIADTGTRRKNASGRSAVVWRAKL